MVNFLVALCCSFAVFLSEHTGKVCTHLQNAGCLMTPKQWERADFDTSHLQNHLIDYGGTWYLELHPFFLPSPRRLPLCRIWFWSNGVCDLGKYPVCHCKGLFFVFFSLFITCTDCTHGPLLTICTSYDVFSTHGCAFWGFLIMLPHLGGHIPKNNFCHE